MVRLRSHPVPTVASSGMAGIVARHAAGEGVFRTPIPFLSLIRFDRPTDLASGMLKPSVCLVVQGGKRTFIGPNVIEYGEGDYIAAAIDMPIRGQVVKAPYLGVCFEFDPGEIAAMVHDSRIQLPTVDHSGPAAYVQRAGSDLADAMKRLVGLLEKSQDIPFLAAVIKHEVLYRVLTSDSGHLLCQSAGPEGRGLSRALASLREQYASPLRVGDLAREAGMSPSAFHRKFKAVTTLTPVQYQKHLRLLEARRQLLSGTADVSTAAFDVGYESASQFSREYKRMFGASPSDDAGPRHHIGRSPGQD